MSAAQILFLAFAALMLFSSAGVIFARNQVYAAMSLVASFFFLAGIYALLFAHLLAVLQILVYAGAIVVLFLFVIMLLSIEEPVARPLGVTPMRALGILAVLGLAYGTVRAATSGGQLNTRVKGIRLASGAVVQQWQKEQGAAELTFDETPFAPSEFSVGALGEGLTTRSKLAIVSVGAGREPLHEARILDGPPVRVGEPIALRWNVQGLDRRFGTVAGVGEVLFTRYLLPFEATSLLLLVAIVGAVVVAKEKI